LKWKSIGAGFHMRQAFCEALLRWLTLDVEGKASGPTTEGNAAWMRRRMVPKEAFQAAMGGVVDAQEASARPREGEERS
jgi:hypothetical protein